MDNHTMVASLLCRAGYTVRPGETSRDCAVIFRTTDNQGIHNHDSVSTVSLVTAIKFLRGLNRDQRVTLVSMTVDLHSAAGTRFIVCQGSLRNTLVSHDP